MVLHSVKSRLLVIVLISLASMAVLIQNQNTFTDKLVLLEHTSQDIIELELKVAHMRKNEQLFFYHKLLDYPLAFSQTYTAFQKRLDLTIKHMQQESMDITYLQKIASRVQTYHDSFYRLVAMYRKLGLLEHDGLLQQLEGFNKGFNDFFARIEHKDLTIVYMKLMTNQQRFFNFQTESELVEHEVNLHKLRTVISKHPDTSALIPTLDRYEKLFREITDIYNLIGFTRYEGLRKVLHDNVQKLEKELSGTTALVKERVKKRKTLVKRIGMGILLFTALIMLLFIATLFRKLHITFNQFINFFKSSKKGYEKIDPEKIDYIEFKKLAHFANEMIDARSTAENHLKEAHSKLKDLNLSLEDRVKKGIAEIVELNNEIEDTQKELILTMGSIGENRSKETGNHVKRVAEYSKVLALAYGMSEVEAETLKIVSPMHDIGKIAIKDKILNKPGTYEAEEYEQMKKHAEIGYEMLKYSNRPLLKAAATVAHEHHENWDGSGYPRGLKGEEIHIYGRIVAIADVFDALCSTRVYKRAWDDKKIFGLLMEERGKKFDPALVDLFFEHYDEIDKIRKTFTDS